MKLLSRDEFRIAVFARDGNKCVVCGSVGVDAHHILERRLWNDGGYYLENGATLCADCHLKAESTVITCDEIRDRAGIKKKVLPDHFYNDNEYDKWGNIILSNGKMMMGELFYDSSVQKILGNKIYSFVDYVKYPRTYHLPWSPGLTEKDKIIPSLISFTGKTVIITEKMDGENTTMYSNHIHARSLDSRSHISRGWVKKLHAKIKHEIPKNYRLCGENLYAKHSIHYTNLRSYFYLFSVWVGDICLSWDDTVTWARLLELEMPNVLYSGLWDENKIRSLFLNPDMEGYVVRIVDSFPSCMFKRVVAKYVRSDHVQTNQHWMNSYTTKNLICE